MQKLVFIALMLMQAVGVAEESYNPDASQTSGAKIWDCRPAGGGETVTLTEARDSEAKSIYEDEPLPTLEEFEKMLTSRETLTPEERERRFEQSKRKAESIARAWTMRMGKIEMAGQIHLPAYNVRGNERWWVWTEGGVFSLDDQLWMFKIVDGSKGFLFDPSTVPDEDGAVTSIANYYCSKRL